MSLKMKNSELLGLVVTMQRAVMMPESKGMIKFIYACHKNLNGKLGDAARAVEATRSDILAVYNKELEQERKHIFTQETDKAKQNTRYMALLETLGQKFVKELEQEKVFMEIMEDLPEENIHRVLLEEMPPLPGETLYNLMNMVRPS